MGRADFVMAAGFCWGTPPGLGGDHGDGDPLLRVHHGLRGAPVRRGTAAGKRRFGEFVSGSPKLSLQALVVALLDAHGYRRRAELFHTLDARWGQHSIDSFATADNCQPPQAPQTSRFCSYHHSPAAVWTDSFTVSRKGENKWVSPLHTCRPRRWNVSAPWAVGTSGTIIAPATPWEKWWSGLGLRRGSGADVIAVHRLVHASDRLLGRPAEARRASRNRNVFAIRLDYRCL